MKAVKAANIDAYIAAFPEDVQKILGQVRLTVRKAAPGAGLHYINQILANLGLYADINCR
jgi:hypothetical protein